jgi:pimeloyl-ACP methyl ester carboxylesterase
VAGLAAAGAAVVGLTPTLSASPQLLANQVYYLPGTQVGELRTDQQSQAFAAAMLAGSGGPAVDPGDVQVIDYPGGFWPVSAGGLSDPTYDASVAEGLADLGAKAPGNGDTVIGFSQGAVVATEYKRAHPNTGVNYVLVENPNRPNGGILERFNGLHVPILDISFNGATPTQGGDTVDISRQYDGWSDFPTYPANLLATANAIAGIIYLHGDSQDLGPSSVSDIDTTHGNTMYYQTHGDTTYYLIPTQRLPILMPLDGIVPDPVLDAADAPLRVLVELGYNRSDYSKPTTAGLAPAVNPLKVAKDLADATVAGIQKGLSESGLATTSTVTSLAGTQSGTAKLAEPKTTVTAPKSGLSKLDLGDIKLPTKLGTSQRLTPPVRTKSSPAKGVQSPAKSIASALKSLAPRKPTRDKQEDKTQDEPTGSVGDAPD